MWRGVFGQRRCITRKSKLAAYITGQDFDRCLAKLRPRMGHYGWALKILRQRYETHGTGGFPHRVYAMLRRFFNPRKPLFIGTSGEGIQFVGDIRDDYSILCAIAPKFDHVLTDFLCARSSTGNGSFLDIGTNHGLVAATVAKRLGEAGDVVAFEPAIETAERAAATFALNGLHRVRLFQAAVGDVGGEIDFYVARGRSAASTAVPEDPQLDDLFKCRVPCYTLDGLADDGVIERASLIKIDVEGYEPQAIRGALQVIQRDRPEVLFEYAPGMAQKLGWRAENVIKEISRQACYRFQVLRYDGALAPMPPPDDYFSNIYCEPS